MKQCKICQQLKPLDLYRKDKSRTDGLSAYCKPCIKARDAQHYKNTYAVKYREKFKERGIIGYELITAAKSKGCYFCSEAEPVCIEFHHTDPKSKDFDVANSRARSLAVLQKEIDKCIPVCSNCHKKLHAGILNYPVLV